MIEMKEIFKNLSNNKKNIVLVICAVSALILLVASGVSEEKVSEDEFDVKLNVSSGEYIKEQEEKLKELIEKIDGAGEAEVMITLESCYENVYLKDSNLKTESTSGVFKEEQEESFIMAKTGSNTQNGVIVKVYEYRY